MIQQIQSYQCASCGGSFLASAGYSENGGFICKTCYDQRTAPAASEWTAPVAQSRPAPAYNGILQGAKILHGQAQLFTFLAFAAIIGGIIAGFFVLIRAEDKGAAVAIAVGCIVGGISSGLILLSTAAMYRMVAELAQAHRDIARNSFR